MFQDQSTIARIGKEAPGDPLIACILFVAQHFGQNFQRGALSALARDERGLLPFHQAEAALDLCLINNERLPARKIRSEARRAGKESVCLCRTRWERYNSKKKINKNKST